MSSNDGYRLMLQGSYRWYWCGYAVNVEKKMKMIDGFFLDVC